MTVGVYVSPGERTSPRWCGAFARGSKGVIWRDARIHPGPVALFGSPRLKHILDQARAEKRTWFYGDHAYFARWKFYRVTRNAFQHTGEGIVPGWAHDRFRRLNLQIKPWRRRGNFVLICPPDQKFAAFHGMDAKKWLDDATAGIRKHTKLPIRIRERGAQTASSLLSALNNCHCLVTHESNAAVEAIMAGTPAIVTGKCAAYAVAGHSFEEITNPPTPADRERWAAVLAANQWTLNEIQSGVAWRALGAA